MPIHISRSPEETERLGRQWGEQIRTGMCIGLSGDLGSGKTRLTQGVARGLGIESPIVSPTFALVHEYLDGRIPLAHLDLYRLDSREAVARAGLDAYLLEWQGAVVIEWIQHWASQGEFLGSGRPSRWVDFLYVDERTRRISYEDSCA